MRIPNMLNRIASVFDKPERFIPGEDATARIIRRLLGPCPICNQKGLDGHTYAEVASQKSPANTEALRYFCELYVSRKWSELNQIHEFDADVNALIIYGLFCLRGGGSMLAVRSAADLYEHDSLEEVILFDEQEAEVIRSLPINVFPVSSAEQA